MDQKVKKKLKRKKIKFVHYSPNAQKVILLGDFNGWREKIHPMKKSKEGIWEKNLFLYPGTYEYKFKVDDNWENDNNNLLTCNNGFGTKNNFIII